MAVKNRDRTYGLFKNGDGNYGNNFNFTSLDFNTTDQLSGRGCFSENRYATRFSDEFVEVDPNKRYQYTIYYRTIVTGSVNILGGGHIGLACYDDQFRFLNIRGQGDIENTRLSRDLNVGDQYVYLENSSSWTPRSPRSDIWNIILIYPETHPDFSTPWEYTRIGYGDVNLYFSESVDIGGGEIRLGIANSSMNPATFPDIGYSTPAGTPISRGYAGGTYNYVHGNPSYPTEWTSNTVIMNGMARQSSNKFRYGTKYVKLLLLANYRTRSQEGGVDQVTAWDNIFFAELVDGKTYKI